MLIGLTLVAINAVVALAAPLLHRFRRSRPDALAAIEGPSGTHCSAPTNSAATCCPGCSTAAGNALLVSLTATVLAVASVSCSAAWPPTAAAVFDEALMRILDAGPVRAGDPGAARGRHGCSAPGRR